MKVYLNSFPWHISPQNSDWKLNRDIARLSERISGLQVYLPNRNWSTALEISAAYAARAALVRLRLSRHAPLSWFPGVPTNHVWSPEFRAFAPDVVYSHYFFPLNIGNTPLILSPGFEDPAEALAAGISPDFLRREFIEKRDKAARSAIVVLTTDEAVRRMQAAYPESAHKIRQLSFYRPNLHAIPAEEVVHKQSWAGPLKLLFVGSQARLKGLGTVYEALAEVQRERPGRWSLDVVSDFRHGDVPMPAGLPIHLHGAQTQSRVHTLFREAHVYVMPSRRESYGFVYIESMAHGCVTVVPRRAIQSEIVDGGRAGITVPAQDAHALAAALIRLIDDPAERLRLALAGHARFLAHYSADVVGRRFVDTFESARRMRDIAAA